MNISRYFPSFSFYFATFSIAAACVVDVPNQPEDGSATDVLSTAGESMNPSETALDTPDELSDIHTTSVVESSQPATGLTSETSSETTHPSQSDASSSEFDSSLTSQSDAANSESSSTGSSSETSSTTMCKPGTERCECLAGEKCEAPLVCLSSICVNDGHCDTQDVTFDPDGVGPCQPTPWFWYAKDGDKPGCHQGPSYWCFCTGSDCDHHWRSFDYCMDAHQDCGGG